MEIQATIQGATTKAIEVTDKEEVTEEAGAVMDFPTGDSVTYVKMTPDSITRLCNVPTTQPQHSEDNNSKPQGDVTVVPA